FQLAPHSAWVSTDQVGGAAGDEFYLRAGFVSPDGAETEALSLTLRALQPQIQAGQRFSKSFTFTAPAALSAFSVEALAEAAIIPIGALGIILGYDLSFFIGLDVDGSVTEHKYVASADTSALQKRGTIKETVLLRSSP